MMIQEAIMEMQANLVEAQAQVAEMTPEQLSAANADELLIAVTDTGAKAVQAVKTFLHKLG